MKLLCALCLAALLAISIPGVLFAAETAAPPTPAPPPAEAATVYAPTDLEPLRAALGQSVTVEGMIVGNGESKSGAVRYLNFSKNFRESVALVFFASKGGDAFSAEKLGAWVGKKVRATGKLGEHNGTLQIEIEKWEQVQETP